MSVPVRAGAHPVWHQQLLPQLAQEATHLLTPRQSQGWDRAVPPVTTWCLKNWGKHSSETKSFPPGPIHKRGASLTLPSLWEDNYS